MRKARVWIMLASLVAGAVAGSAQQAHKAGLWKIATTTRIQQPGDTPANLAAGIAPSAEAGLPVCVTQDLIDKYGVILPPSLRDCEISHVVQTADSFHADMTCKGAYNGIGSIESTWTDEDHVVGKVRFVARTGDSNNSSGGRALAWVQEASAVFKGFDCGSVRPRRIPVKP